MLTIKRSVRRDRTATGRTEVVTPRYVAPAHLALPLNPIYFIFTHFSGKVGRIVGRQLLPLTHPRGRWGRTPPHRGSIFFHFHTFFLAKIIGFPPYLCGWRTLLWEILDPPPIPDVLFCSSTLSLPSPHKPLELILNAKL